jgi:type IV secretion system protein TrbF
VSKSQFIPEGEIETPFNMNVQGLAALDNFNGINQKNARTWQVIALVSLSSFFISIVLLTFAIRMPKTVPVIVTVAPNGEATYVGKVDRSLYNSSRIPENAKLFQMETLIERMFMRTIDRSAENLYIKEAGAIVQDGAVKQLDSYYRANNPFTDIGSRIVSVDIEPPLRQTDKTYIVYFNTTTKNSGGYELFKERYSMLITLGYFEASQKNPLGIYVTNFDIKKIDGTSN